MRLLLLAAGLACCAAPAAAEVSDKYEDAAMPALFLTFLLLGLCWAMACWRWWAALLLWPFSAWLALADLVDSQMLAALWRERHVSHVFWVYAAFTILWACTPPVVAVAARCFERRRPMQGVEG